MKQAECVIGQLMKKKSKSREMEGDGEYLSVSPHLGSLLLLLLACLLLARVVVDIGFASVVH